MHIGEILNATRTPEGIMIRRVGSLPDSDGNMQILVDEVLPDDAGWLEAVAALASPDVEPSVPNNPDIDINTLRASARASVNAMMREVRGKYLTDLPGQEMIYLRKETEARAWLANPTDDLGAYPLLAAEIGITAASANDLAQLWVTNADQWIAVASMLETIRMQASVGIDTASDQAGVDAIVAQTALHLSAFLAG